MELKLPVISKPLHNSLPSPETLILSYTVPFKQYPLVSFLSKQFLSYYLLYLQLSPTLHISNDLYFYFKISLCEES